MQPRLLQFLLATPLCLSAHLFSSDFQVISGSASSTQTGNLTTIENSPHAILHWNDFSIPEQNHLHFAQVSAASTVLNRVTGNNMSALLGTLSSNGQVYLINPNGILIGPHAEVLTAGFLASTANLSDEQFLASKELLFSFPGEGTIVNQGSIQCGDGNLFLIARDVINQGECAAGFIGIGSAVEVLIQPQGAQRIYIRPDPIHVGEVINEGTLEALAIEMKTSSHYEKGIRIEGPHGELKLTTEGGRIILSAEEGGVQLEGSLSAPGGEVHVLGQSIFLGSTSSIDVSGATGGGTVLIGGDYQGANAQIPNAQSVIMENGAQIHADALLLGDGGKVILWADDTTWFDGQISAKGGAQGGSGGFVETSGKLSLSVQTGFVNTSAPLGNYGSWLLDPASIVVQTGGVDAIDPVCASASTLTIDPATLAAAVTDVILCAQNAAGSSVTVNSPIVMTANAGINLTLTAGSGNAGPLALNANITTAGGSVTCNGVATLGTTVQIDTTNGGLSAGAAISFNSTINATTAGVEGLTLNAGSGFISLAGIIGGGTRLGALSLTSTHATGVTIGNSITASAFTTVAPTKMVLSLAGTTTISTAAANGALFCGGAINGTTTGAQSLILTAGSGLITLSGAVGTGTKLGTFNVTTTNATGAIIQDDITSNSFAATGATNVQLFKSGTTTISTTGTVSIGGTLNGTVSGAQALSINSPGSIVTFTQTIGNSIPLASLSASGSTIIQSSSNITTGAVSYTGTSLITLAGNITTTSGALTFTGVVSLGNTTNRTFDTTNGTLSSGADIFFSNNFNASSLTATQLVTIRAGSGTVTFTGGIGASNSWGMLNVTGATIIQSSAATTQKSLSYTATTGISLAGDINISASTPASISINGPTTFTGNRTFTSTSGAVASTISFSGSLDGSGTLSMFAGVGSVTLNATIGANTPPANLTFTGSTLSARIGSDITVSGANPLTFSPQVTFLAGSSTITTNNAALTFSNLVNGFNNGVGNATLKSGTATTTFLNTVGGTFYLGNLSVESSNATGLLLNTSANVIRALSFTTTNATTMQLGVAGTTTITAFGTGTGIALGGAVVGTSASAQALSLQGGSGTITVSNNIGTVAIPLSTITLNTTNTTTNAITLGGTAYPTSGAQSYTAGTAGLMNVSGTVDFTTTNSPITFSTGTLTPASSSVVTLTAGSGAISISPVNGDATTTLNFSNTGTLTTTGGAGTGVTIGTLNFNTNPSSISLGGNVTTLTSSLTFPVAVTLTADSIVTTTNQPLQFNSTINGARNLTLASGSSTITLSTSLTTAPLLSSLTLNSSNTGTTAINLNGTTYSTTGLQSYTAGANGQINVSGAVGFNTTNSAITFSTGTLTPAAASVVTLTAGSGAISVGPVNGNNTTTLHYVNTGTAATTGPITIGTLDFTAPSTISIGNNITSLTGALTFPSATILTATSTIDTSTNNTAIVFSSTVNGTVAGAQGLTLTPGSGSATFSGIVGGSTRPADISVTSSNATGLILNTSAITAKSLTTTGSTTTRLSFAGNTTVNTNSTGTGISFGGAISGTAANTQGLILQAGSGTVNIGNNAGTIAVPLATFTITTTNTTTNAITFGGTTYQTSGAQSYTSGAASQINVSGTVGFTTSNNPITFSTGTLSLAPASVVTLTAGSGAISVGPASGDATTTLHFINTGTVTTTGAITVGTLDFTSPTGISIGNNITALTSSLSFPAAVTLTGNSIITTTNQPISFSSTINGAQTLSLTPGSGIITLSGSVGNTTALTSLALTTTSTSANAITFGGTLYRTTGSQNYTTGIAGLINVSGTVGFTTTLNGPITFATGTLTPAAASSVTLTSGSGAISVGPVNGGATTALHFVNTGTVTTNSTVTIGTLDFTAPSSISLGGNVTALTSALTFPSAVTLTTDAIVTTTNQPLQFSSTINGAHNLSLASGSGTITLSTSVATAPILTSLTLTSSNTGASAINLNGTTYTTTGSQSYTAGVGGQINVSGTAGFNTTNSPITFATGTLTPAAASSVTLTSGSGAISVGPVNGGATTALHFVNTGTVTTNGSVTIGTLDFTAPSSISLGGNVTALTSALTFPSAVTLTTDAIVTTTNQPLQFSSTINGAHNLSLASGSGTITLSTSLATAPILTSLTLNSSNTGATAINLNGTTYTTTGLQSYTAGAGGQINVSGTVGFNTTNSPITFATGTLTPAAASVVTLTSGSGAISVGPVNGGATTALHFVNTGTVTTTGAITIGTLDFTAPSSISLGGNVTALTSALTFPSAVTLTTDAIVTTTNQPLQFSSTINGAHNLSLASGSGTITLSTSLATAPILTSLTLNSSNTGATAINLNGTAYTTTGSQSYTAGVGGQINVSGTVGFNTTNSPITFATGTLTPAAASVVTLTAGSGAISVGPVNGDATTTLHFVNTGTVTTTGAITIGTLDFTAPSSISIGGNITVLTSNLNFPAPTTITATSLITTSVGSISITNPFTWSGPFNLTLLGAHAVTVTNTNITSSGTGVNAGNLTIQGNGTGAGSFAGITLSNSNVSTADGTLSLTGTGGSTADNNHGIDILAGSTVSTTGATAMTLVGTGGNGGNSNYGIHLNASTTTAVAGTISFNGTGNGSGTNNYGVFLEAGAVVQSTGSSPSTLSCGPAVVPATLCLVGQGGSLGSSSNEGVLITGMGTLVTSVAGPISIQGTGGGLSTTNTGVQIDTGAQVTSTLTAPITLNGAAGPGADSWGIQISGTNSKINSLTGAITLIGTGGAAGNGIEVTSAARVTGTLAAPLSIQSLNNSDILISSNAIIETLLGSLSVTTSRDLILLGGVNPLEVALLRFATSATFSIGRDIVITGGSSMGALARIEALAASIANFTLGRHLSLTGGSGMGASASIEPLFSSSVLQFGTMQNLTMTGGSGGDAYAQIGSSLTTATGNITFSSINGNVLLDASTGNSHVAIGHGQHANPASTLSGTISLSAAGNISLLGSNVSANGFVQIGHVNQTAGGSTLSGNITVQSTNGSISLLGGNASSASYAQIGLGGQVAAATYGASTVQVTAHNNCSFTSVAGAGQATVISPGSGNITVLASGIGSGTYAGILADGALIECVSGNISLTGTGGTTGANNSGIHITNAASITSALGAGTITLIGNGGPGTTGNHGILADIGSVVATASGALSATGTGTNSDGMQINGATYTSVDGPQTFVGTATGTLVDNRGIAVINGGVVSSTGLAGTGTITMTGTGSPNGTTGNHGILVTDAMSSITSVTGDIALTGTGNGSGANNRGVSIENAASVTSTGSSGITLSGTGGTTATNSWGVLVTDASTLVSSAGGAITLNGTAGGATAQGARITSGAQVTSTGSGTISLGTFNTSDLSIDTNAVVITTANAAITVNSSRDVLITGGSNINEAARIDSDANGVLSITTSRDLILTGGSNTNTSAQIQNNAPGNAFFTIGRDLSLIGGSGAGAEASIHPTGATSSLLFGTIGRDLTLTSGSGLNAIAQIGSFQTIEDGNILFGMIGGNVILTATDTNSFAAIGHGLPGNAVSTLSGYIQFPFVMGNVTLQGASAGAGTQGFAQIGHIDQIGQSSTLTGNITINNLGSITVNGGSAAASARAQIGPGGQSLTTLFGASTNLLTAGVNCSLQGAMGAGDAIITNPAGDLTIVVDNLFPTAPSIGPGAFNFGSTLFATGNLQIYTATQAQNSVPSGSILNGQVYVPGTEFVDTSTEEWDTYYPGGTYGGASFKFYYKNNGNPIPPTPPTPPAPPPSPSAAVIANEGSLADLIRGFISQAPSYLITDCNVWLNRWKRCDLIHSTLVIQDEEVMND